MLTLQLHPDFVADLLDGLEETAAECDATIDYLEGGYCRDDVAVLAINRTEDAEWRREFCNATYVSIMSQLARNPKVPPSSMERLAARLATFLAER